MIVRYKFRTDRPVQGGLRAPRPPQAANSFLFAEVGTLPNGTSLTVMSMLAQQDIDPWEEAARLRDTPAREAVPRLAALIQASGLDLPSADAPAAVASRLVRLLYLAQSEASVMRRAPAGRMTHEPAGAQRRSIGRGRAQRAHALRLGILVAAVTTLIVIGLLNPRAIVTSSGIHEAAAPSSQVSAGSAARMPGQPDR